MITRPTTGTIVGDTFNVRMRFGGNAPRGRWFNLEAVQVQPATPGVDILIGIDLLRKLDMFWLGPQRRVVLHY